MPLSYKKIERILLDFGFEKVRQKGSHQRFCKDGYGITVSFHKEFAPKTAQSMLKDIARIVGRKYKDLLDTYHIKL